MNTTGNASKNVLNSDVEIKGNIKFSGELTFDGKLDGEIHTEPFSPERFARACTICQPATLVRRSAWERVPRIHWPHDSRRSPSR